MSSTSLSSCDFCPCNCVLEDSCYGRIIRPATPVPLFTATGQPLVYYAQVQPYDRRLARGQSRKEKNFFLKAFKWYTQDRDPETKRNPDLTGFASWLDDKYSQYLEDSEEPLSRQSLFLQPQQTSTVESTACTSCRTNQPRTPKRFARMKSPWSKFRHLNKNAGDVILPKTPNKSCEFLLQPKDMTRPTSECFYENTAVYPNKSNDVSQGDGSNKTVVKSKSITTIYSELISQNQIETMTVQEGLNTRSKEITKPQDSKRKTIPSNSQNFKMPVRKGLKKMPYKSERQNKQVTPTTSIVDVSHTNIKEGMNVKQDSAKPQTIHKPCDHTCKSNKECRLIEEMRLMLELSLGDHNQVIQQDKRLQPNPSKANLRTREPSISYGEGVHECQCPKEIETSVMEEMNTMPSSDHGHTHKQKHVTAKDIKTPSRTDISKNTCDQTCAKLTQQKRKLIEEMRQLLMKTQMEKSGDHNAETKPAIKVMEEIPRMPSKDKYRSQRLQVPSTPVKKDMPGISSDRVSPSEKASNIGPNLQSLQCECLPKKETNFVKRMRQMLEQSLKVDYQCECPKEAIPHVEEQVQCECSHHIATNLPLPSPFSVQPSKLTTIQPSSPIMEVNGSSCVQKKMYKIPVKVDVACQTSQENIIKFDTPSQYDRKDCVYPDNVFAFTKSGPQRSSIIEQRADSSSARNSVTVKKISRLRTICRVSDSVQTSDHSISLENGHEYALFMKIICADKLNNCSCE